MNNKFSTLLILLSVAGAVAGGLTGYFLPDAMVSISFIGSLFLSALKIIVIPFVIALVITGIAQMKDSGKIRRIYSKTIGYFLSTSFLAALFGVVVAMVLQPGVGAGKEGASFPEEIIPELSSFSFNQLFSSMLPENILSASSEMQVFGLILLSILLGLVLTQSDRKNKIVLDFFVSLSETMSKAVQYVFYAAPIGIFSLTGYLFAVYSDNTAYLFSSMLLYSSILFLSFSFFALVILPIIMRIFTPYSPYRFLGSLIPALATAFATDSQMATLPLTKESISEEVADSRATAFVIPLGAVFNANGTALFLSFSAMFIAQMYGLSISVLQIAGLIGASMVISCFASFIPYASLFILALVMQIAGFPIHVTAAIGIIIMVDFLFSRIRTVVNVWGDAVGTAVIGSSFDFKTARNAQVAKKTSRGSYAKVKNSKTRPVQTKTRDNKDKSSKDKDSSTKTKRSYAKRENTKPVRSRSKTTKEPYKKQTVSKPAPVSSARKEEPKKEAVQAKSPFVMPPVPYHVLETELKPTVKKNGQVAQTDKSSVKTSSPETKGFTQKSEPKKEMVAQPAKQNNKPAVKEQPEIEAKNEPVNSKSNNSLSQDTIERERKKIAAQLNSMRDREATLDKKVKADLEKTDEILPEVPQTAKKGSYTTIDYVSEIPPTTPTAVKTITEKETAVSEKAVQKVMPKQPEKAASIEQVSNSEKVSAPESRVIENTPAETEPEKPTFGRSKQRKGPKPSATKSSSSSDENGVEVSEKTDYSPDKMSFGRSKRKK